MNNLKKHIKENNPKNVYLFFGEEAFLRNYYKNSLINLLLEKIDSFNYIKLEIEKISLLQDAVFTIPFGYNKKVVEVTGDSDSSIKDNDLSFIDEVLKNRAENVYVIFNLKTTDKRKKFYKHFQKNEFVCEFNYQKPEDIIIWMDSIFRKNKIDISKDNLIYLFEHTNNDMTNAYNEINKLISFCLDKKTVTKEDIDAISTKTQYIKTFDMIDFAAMGNTKKAFLMLKEMENQKEEPVMIIGAISKHLKNLLIYKILKEEKKSDKDIIQKMKMKKYPCTWHHL